MRHLLLLVSVLAACGEAVDAAPPLPPPPDAARDAAPPDAAPAPPVEVDFGLPDAPDPLVLEPASAFEGSVSLWIRDQSTGAAAAHDADRPVFSGSLMRLVPVLAYARRVDVGGLSPHLEVPLEARHVRAGGTGATEVGATFSLEELARRVVVDADRTAEALLVSALGGSAVLGTADLGLGRYLAPCEVDRAFATALDARFEALDCVSLSRWMATRDDADAGFEVPQLGADARQRAWAAVTVDGAATGTAAAWGELFARIDRGAFVSRAASAHVRDLLDQGPGGGGGDEVPARAWIGGLEGVLYRGRHWVGLVRDGPRTTVVVVLTDAHERAGLDSAALFAQTAAAAHRGDEAWPPDAVERPEWITAVMLVGDGYTDCDADRFDGLLDCHRAARVSGYAAGESGAASVFLQGGPRARTAWFWSEPGGRRHRFQAVLERGGWWVWTHTFPVARTGDWHAGVYVNDEPYLSRFFPVR